MPSASLAWDVSMSAHRNQTQKHKKNTKHKPVRKHTKPRNSKMTMTMKMTHSHKVNQHQSEARPYGHECRGHNSAKKESVETVVPCVLGKVCNWDTVERQCAVT